ncbi:dTDP-glucose 4,6-dehydratase [Croceicoccus naphthovorans]|uniref:dTDP-glucose 4,6-dehydratase n=1 Tax=Croceicoccus naphthovorans TaxID=1348774 RepID=A0A0G3XHS7_9SPHN|nr:dTDP-glucose 4,6-dehydratase [Croceicoccus naphthovorans]AKM10154.1 spore coat protein [Croceicoccus naphthovorans]MBB3990618.1 dTDP-glucose 4,6-dehydratase [Croceicoccus naphthovorans]
MSKLLVTGGAGFIGSNFVRYWRDSHPDDQIVVLDGLTYAGNMHNLDGIGSVDVRVGDIRNGDMVGAIMREHDIDTIVHFAAESHVDRSISGPDDFIDTNIVGTHELLKQAKLAWLDGGSGRPHRFHHVSTDEVYGTLGPNDPAFNETTPYAPNSPYAASKAASDHLVRAYHHTYGLQTTVSNCSNNYGPFQFPEKLIPLFIINALHGRDLPIYGDGMQVRDWLYVEDHCRGIDLVIERGQVGECYNIGGGEEMANLSVIETLCEAMDEAFESDDVLAARFPDSPAAKGLATSSLKKHVTDRPGHDRRYAIDESKINGELGYRARYGFAENFRATLNWYLSNEVWWRQVMDGSYRQWLDTNYASR